MDDKDKCFPITYTYGIKPKNQKNLKCVIHFLLFSSGQLISLHS